MGRVWFTCRGRDEWCRKVRQKSNEILKLTNAKQLKKTMRGYVIILYAAIFCWMFFIIFVFLSLFEGLENYKTKSEVYGLVVGEDCTKTHMNPLDIMKWHSQKNTIDSIAPRLALGYRLVDQIQFCRFGTGDIDKVQPFDGGTS